MRGIHQSPVDSPHKGQWRGALVYSFICAWTNGWANNRDACDHDDVIKWKHFPRYWPFLRGIHRSPVNSPHKGQWRGALMFSLICALINGWVNNREAGDLRRYRAHYDVIVMFRRHRAHCVMFQRNPQRFAVLTLFATTPLTGGSSAQWVPNAFITIISSKVYPHNEHTHVHIYLPLLWSIS